LLSQVQNAEAARRSSYSPPLPSPLPPLPRPDILYVLKVLGEIKEKFLEILESGRVKTVDAL
jgi:hypothetical protein